MGSFLRGLLLGIGFSWLIAPMRGQEMRQLISERVQQLRVSVPQTMHLGEDVQQTPNPVSPIADDVKATAQQVTSQVKSTAIIAEDVAAQTSTHASQAGQDVAAAAKQDPRAASQTPPSIQVNANTSSTTILLRSIPGVDTETQRKLQTEGILTTQQLLEHTSTKEERADLAHKVGLGTHALRVFVTHADLMRLQGVGGDVATLLEEAGVTGCMDLQQRNPEHLHTKLTEVQESRKILASTPDLEQITQWIAEAMAVTGSPKE